MVTKKANKINNLENVSISFNFEKNKIDLLFDILKKIKIKPDIIINNVGGNLNITDPLCNSKDAHKVFNLNLYVPIEINKKYLPHMIKKKWGRIVHISSISSLENQGPPAYCASKAALNAYVRSVGRYVSKHNVIMTSLLPGAIMTKGGYWDNIKKYNSKHFKNYQKNRMAINRFGNPEEISNFVIFLASDNSSFAPGSSFLVDGGQGRVFNNIEN